jgi:hypothetical protein
MGAGWLPKYLMLYIDPARWGHVAEWLRNGLQNRVHQFNSGRGLHPNLLFSPHKLIRNLFRKRGLLVPVLDLAPVRRSAGALFAVQFEQKAVA